MRTCTYVDGALRPTARVGASLSPLRVGHNLEARQVAHVVLELAKEAGDVAARLERGERGIAAIGLPAVDARDRVLHGQVARRAPRVDVVPQVADRYVVAGVSDALRRSISSITYAACARTAGLAGPQSSSSQPSRYISRARFSTPRCSAGSRSSAHVAASSFEPITSVATVAQIRARVSRTLRVSDSRFARSDGTPAATARRSSAGGTGSRTSAGGGPASATFPSRVSAISG